MRILLVSYFFPPFDSAGAVRTGKVAAYLTRFGHDVRVVSAREQSVPSASLPVDLPADRVVYTRWWGARRVIDMLGGRGRSVGRSAQSHPARMPAARRPGLLRSLLYFPDGQNGWLPFAIRAARRMTRDWLPDVVLASSSPATSLIVACAVARRLGVPWVADLRDLWVDNHTYVYPNWRKRLERRLEQFILSRAASIVTVSAPLADVLRTRYRAVSVVMNGFDPSDVPEGSTRREHFLEITYTGSIYPGYQSPAPLFEAMQQMGECARAIRVTFIGSDPDAVLPLAAAAGVSSQVSVLAAMPHAEALARQRSADILLFLLWNDPLQRGVYTTKLFEYIGMRRPILAIGSGAGVAAELIRTRRVGAVATDATQVEAKLHAWLQDWREAGSIEDIVLDAASDLTREYQTRNLERVLIAAVARHGSE